MSAKEKATVAGKPVELWDLSELDAAGADKKRSVFAGGAKAKETDTAKPAVPNRIDFGAHSEALVQQQPQVRQRWVPLIGLAFFATLLLWASIAKIDQVTRGHGKVIPASGVQRIQSLEGGIVDSIQVNEGEMVEQGQVLIQLQDTLFNSNYQENAVRRDFLAGRVARLQAESQGFIKPDFPDLLNEQNRKVETELFNIRRDDFLARERAIAERLSLAEEEISILTNGRQSVSRLELVTSRRVAAELRGQLNTLRTTQVRDALEQHDGYRSELLVLDESLKRDKDRLDRTTLRSPVQGIVNKIHVEAVGEIVDRGDDMMEIVPLGDSLLIEANVRPSDIGFIHADQPAVVKFTAYEFTTYGGLEGTVEYIGVDTVSDAQGDSYYPIRVRASADTLGVNRDGKDLQIIPGMVAEVDLLTGEKTVLQYLLTPINRAREKALTEN